MNTESDWDEAEYLKDYLAGRLRSTAIVKNITGTLAENLDFKGELCTSDCLILISSRQASSLIQEKWQETQGNYITRRIHKKLRTCGQNDCRLLHGRKQE